MVCVFLLKLANQFHHIFIAVRIAECEFNPIFVFKVVGEGQFGLIKGVVLGIALLDTYNLTSDRTFWKSELGFLATGW